MKKPKIVKLEIEDNSLLSGVDAISFVESPAIEIDFQYFSKQVEEFETYNDYPQKAIDNAKRGIELNEEFGNKCATQVGKVRAQQLAKGENLSLDTIRRMRAFLIRQRDNYELALKRKDYSACGYISYLLWGGDEALPWAEKKLRQAGEEFDLALEIPDYSNEINEEDINNFIFEKLIELEVTKDAWIEELTDDIEDAVESALLNVGITDQDLIDAGYDLESAVVIDDKESFVATVSEIKRASAIDKPSVDDFGDKQVLYRYMRYDGTQSYGDNSRKFCQNVIKSNMWFRKEDINKLTIQGANEGFGLNGSRLYDIFTYKGGKNCQHYWQAIQFSRDIKATEKDKPQAILDRIIDATTLNPDTLTNLLATGRLKLSKEQMDEQQIVATPIMVPNKLIPRRDENGDLYYVYFTEDTIKKIAYAFAKSKNTDSINLEHDMDSMIDDVYLAESWIVDEPSSDKSNMYGYTLEKGSWFGLFKVNNGTFWKDYIKTGKVKGVSVEGYFINKLTKLV
jgi:hypothetical protein